MTPQQTWHLFQSRRQFLGQGKNALGFAALSSLLGEATARGAAPTTKPGAPLSAHGTGIGPHFAPKAKNVIYLHMVGGPSQIDTFDYKPVMNEWFDKDLPDSIRK